MRSDAVQLVFLLFVLVVGAAAECLLPKPFGTGFPILLSAALFAAVRRPVPVFVTFALAAGGAEDALTSLPLMTSPAFFLLAAASVRWSGSRAAVAAVAAPVYQFWLWLWAADPGSGVFLRFVVSVPAGFVTASLVAALLGVLERKAAADVG